MAKVVLVAVLAACGLAGGTAEAGPGIRTNPPALSLLRASESGDTLLYRLRWGAGFGASGYKVSVYAIPTGPGGAAPGAWVAIPTMPATVTAPEITVVLTAAAWDSARFRAVVWSTRGSSVSRDSSFVEWSVVRLGGPGPIQVDSSAVVVGFTVRKIPLDSSAGSFALCPVVTFKDGRQGVPTHYHGGPCQDVRGGLLDTLNARQLAKLDSIRFTVSNDAAPHGQVTLTTE